MQPKLLKVLEAHQFRRLGDVRDRTVDIRLISATHRDLKELVRLGRFREDLFFRITIIPIRIPPLRERPEDIPLLANDILGRISSERGGGFELDIAAMEVLRQYPWPGNIREMRNVLERAAQIAQHPVLTVRDIELQYPAGPPGDGNANGRNRLTGNRLTLRELEARYIEAVLRDEEGSIDRAARRLGISRSSLYNKVRNKEVERRSSATPALLPFAD